MHQKVMHSLTDLTKPDPTRSMAQYDTAFEFIIHAANDKYATTSPEPAIPMKNNVDPVDLTSFSQLSCVS